MDSCSKQYMDDFAERQAFPKGNTRSENALQAMKSA
jgi:hypothetical protein